MAVEMDKYHIPLFNGNNFDNWKFRLTILMEDKDCAECLNGLPEVYKVLETDSNTGKASKEKKIADFQKKDRKCKSIITQFLSDSHLEYVKDKYTAQEMWESLSKTFQRKGIANQLYLRKQLLQLKVDDDKSLTLHFLTFDGIIRKLKGCGANLEEIDIICHLLLTLPKSYEMVVTAIETLGNDLTLEYVKGRLLDEEAKRQSKASKIPENSTAFTGKSYNHSYSNKFQRKQFNLQPVTPESYAKGNFNYKCHSCGQYGHKRYECKRNPCKDKAKNYNSRYNFNNKTNKIANSGVKEESSSEEDVVVFVAELGQENVKSIKWFIDSGATDHMTNDHNYFFESWELPNPVNISVAKSGETITAVRAGNIKGYVNVEGTIQTCTLKNVLYVPKLRYNLFSVRRLEQFGLRTTFENKKAVIQSGNKIVAIAKRTNTLYELEIFIDSDNTQESIAKMTSVQTTTDLWHKRFGHIGVNDLMKIITKNMVIGLDGNIKISNYQCETCLYGKMTKLPHNNSRIRAKRPLELIHSDVCGPITPSAWNGGKYFVTFVDDYTHFTQVYILKHKSEVFEVFKTYKAKVCNHFGTRLSRLRCDGGGEYISNEFKKYCQEEGIQVEYNIPYTPEQNGVAERMNRTILDKARSMMLGSELSQNLWNEAVVTAVYLINRSPTSAIMYKSPAELWYGRKPNVSKFKTFGCVAYLHTPKNLRGKFDAKCEKLLMIGYTTNGYRLWNPNLHKVINGHDVTFGRSI